MIDVLFRVDDGLGIGSGHLMRCLALAEAIADVGGNPHLVASKNSPIHQFWPTVDAKIVTHGLEIGSADDLMDTIGHAQKLGVDWVVVDGYAFAESWLDALASQQRLLFLDDLGDRNPKAAIVLNQNAGAEHRYGVSYPRVDLSLLGLDWFLLRRAWRSVVLEPDPYQLLITLGGDDRHNMAHAMMLEILRKCGNFRTDVVCSAPEAEFIQSSELAVRHPDRFNLHRAPVDLPRLMARAAVVICGGGVTPVEAASLGVPAVIVVLAENQLPGARALMKLGTARAVLTSESPAVEAVRFAFEFLENETVISKASSCGRRLVDGKGASRVVEIMMKAIR
jgi:UDP-2,4-diacetamido-2,4,6-trideoxy-beta-L-altropyranose hydrolase